MRLLSPAGREADIVGGVCRPSHRNNDGSSGTFLAGIAFNNLGADAAGLQASSPWAELPLPPGRSIPEGNDHSTTGRSQQRRQFLSSSKIDVAQEQRERGP
jgi:hypothetical protein